MCPMSLGVGALEEGRSAVVRHPSAGAVSCPPSEARAGCVGRNVTREVCGACHRRERPRSWSVLPVRSAWLLGMDVCWRWRLSVLPGEGTVVLQ